MIHKNDEIKRRFYQVDKLLLENPKYEKLSDGAILAWSILRDRLELSKKNSDVYSDEEGYLFLTFTDEELGEILHRNRKTASARKKELEKFGLLYSVRMGNQEPNRLYILEPETCDPSLYISEQYRRKKKDEFIQKQVERAKNQKKKYVMIEVPEDTELSYPQEEILGGVVMGKKRTSVMGKKRTSGDVKNGHLDVQELGSNDTKDFYTNSIDTENEEEEQQTINRLFPQLIKEVLGAEGVYDDSMIAQIILEMKKRNLSFLTRKEMIDQHRKMMRKREAGEDIWVWPEYFVGGIIKNRLSESTAQRQNRLAEAEKFQDYSRKTQEKHSVVPFYNWLDS
jgi:Replication initiator protein A (RepA) N-terminus